MSQLNQFVFNLNNKLQELPIDRRLKITKKIIDDMFVTKDGQPSDIFTPISEMETEEDWDAIKTGISVKNDAEKEMRILALQTYYGTQGDIMGEEGDEEDQEHEHLVKTRCGRTDLHEAVMMGDLDLIRKLIASGLLPVSEQQRWKRWKWWKWRG